VGIKSVLSGSWSLFLKKKSVTIRIAPDVLESYKTMGDGYTGIMADVLQYVVNNPSVLTEATK
jgi:uncharacterized protein (DUF4415 family)